MLLITRYLNLEKVLNRHLDMADKLTAILIGGTGATGKEVLKELNAADLVSKIIFISRRALEFPEQPKVRNLIEILYCYRT